MDVCVYVHTCQRLSLLELLLGIETLKHKGLTVVAIVAGRSDSDMEMYEHMLALFLLNDRAFNTVRASNGC